MFIKNVLDLDGRDVFAAGDDDVLGSILDDDIAVFVKHAEIAGVKPAAGKRFLSCFLIFEIALHDDIPPEHHLPDGLAIARHLAHRFRIDHRDGFLQRVGHALPSFQLGTLIGRQTIPAGLLCAYRRRAINLGQAVYMRELDPDAFSTLEYSHWGCCPGDQSDDTPRGGAFRWIRRVDERVVDNRRAGHVSDLMPADQFEYLRGIDLAQADIDAGRGRDGPWEAPAVAVKHRQRPEIDRVLPEVAGEDITDRIEIGAPVMSHHALWIACCPRGITERDGFPFVLRQTWHKVFIALCQRVFIFDPADLFSACEACVVYVDDERLRPFHEPQRLGDHC